MYQLKITTPKGEVLELKPNNVYGLVKLTGPSHIELIDSKTQLGPKALRTVRKGNALDITMKLGQETYELVLEDFYLYEGQQLQGMAPEGKLVNYIPAQGDAAQMAQLLTPDQESWQVLASKTWLLHPHQAGLDRLVPDLHPSSDLSEEISQALVAGKPFTVSTMALGALGVVGLGGALIGGAGGSDHSSPATPSAAKPTPAAKSDTPDTPHAQPESLSPSLDTAFKKGDTTLDLGAGLGKLIQPFNVEGRWFYHWDKNGDGSANQADTSSYDQAQSALQTMNQTLAKLGLTVKMPEANPDPAALNKTALLGHGLPEGWLHDGTDYWSNTAASSTQHYTLDLAEQQVQRALNTHQQAVVFELV